MRGGLFNVERLWKSNTVNWNMIEMDDESFLNMNFNPLTTDTGE